MKLDIEYLNLLNTGTIEQELLYQVGLT